MSNINLSSITGNIIYLKILGDPVAQKRHRSTTIHTKAGKQFTSEYDPSQTKKKDFLSIVQDNAPEVPWDCPIHVRLEFIMKRPQGHYGSGKNAGVLKSSSPEWHTGRPDVDNLQKFIYDALNGVYWRDDGQICSVDLVKKYGEKPCTTIVITKIN